MVEITKSQRRMQQIYYVTKRKLGELPHKYGNYPDAERLSQKANSELEFARQIATTSDTPH